MSKRKITQREADRIADCQQRAIFKMYELESGRRTFESILAKIVKRWPVSAGGAEFQADLRRRFENERA